MCEADVVPPPGWSRQSVHTAVAAYSAYSAPTTGQRQSVELSLWRSGAG